MAVNVASAGQGDVAAVADVDREVQLTVLLPEPEHPPGGVQGLLHEAEDVLASGLPDRAASLVAQVHASGGRSGRSSFLAGCCLVSGRPLQQVDLTSLSLLHEEAAELPADDPHVAALSLLQQLVRQAVLQPGPGERAVSSGVESGVQKLERDLAHLPADLLSHILRHADRVLTGALRERVQAAALTRPGDAAADLRSRGRQVAAFFVPDAHPPVQVPPRALRWGQHDVEGSALLAGVVVLALVDLLGMVVSAGTASGWVAFLALLVAAAVLGDGVHECAWRRLHAARRRARYQEFSQPADDTQPAPPAGLVNAVDRAFAQQLEAAGPADSARRTGWSDATRAVRRSLVEEVSTTYGRVPSAVERPETLLWLAWHHATRLREAWEADELPTQARPRFPARAVLPLLLGGGTTLLLLLALLGSTGSHPGGTVVLALLIAAGVTVARRRDPWSCLGLARCRREEQAHSDERFAAEGRSHQTWLRWTGDRPHDERLGRWLDEDCRSARAAALRHHSLRETDVFTHLVLAEGRADGLLGRYGTRPTRFERYRLKVFLLGQQTLHYSGVDLDFRDGQCAVTERRSVRLDALATVETEPGRAQRVDLLPGGEPIAPDLGGASGQLNWRRLLVTLRGAEPIEVRWASLARRAAESGDVWADEGSDLDTAAAALATVAADGSAWSTAARRRRLLDHLEAFGHDPDVAAELSGRSGR